MEYEQEIENRLRLAAVELAKTPPAGSAAASIEHCEAQCNYWRLSTALAAVRDHKRDLRVSSQQAETWEQRRGQAIKLKKADDLAACRRMFEAMTTAGVEFESLDG